MVALVASFLVGVGLTLLVTRLISRPRSAPKTPAINPERERLEETITAFGEELEGLRFDPSGVGATEAMVADYRAALDAYEKAKAVPVGQRQEARVTAALGKGHAALIRLDARIHHRPVPIEAIEDDFAPPKEVTGDRFLTEGRKAGVYEVIVDRPEPGAYAIAEFTYRGDSNFFVHPLTRTENTFQTLQAIVNAQRTYRGRHLVPPEVTHFRIEAGARTRSGRRGFCRPAPRFRSTARRTGALRTRCSPTTGGAPSSSPRCGPRACGGSSSIPATAPTGCTVSATA